MPTGLVNRSSSSIGQKQIYFGSLGRTGMKMLERACGRRGISARDAVELLVPHWRDLGAVVDVNGALMFAE